MHEVLHRAARILERKLGDLKCGRWEGNAKALPQPNGSGLRCVPQADRAAGTAWFCRQRVTQVDNGELWHVSCSPLLGCGCHACGPQEQPGLFAWLEGLFSVGVPLDRLDWCGTLLRFVFEGALDALGGCGEAGMGHSGW